MEFFEKQKLNLWWLYIIVAIEAIMVLAIIFFHKGGMTLAQLREIYFAPFLAILLPFCIIYLITENKFSYRINELGIYYNYWPFARNKFINWSFIDSIYLRKYDAMGEYGGWGVKNRLWFKLNDKAYIMNSENLGLQIELKNQKRLLFSTLKADELELFLINLKRKFDIAAIKDVRER